MCNGVLRCWLQAKFGNFYFFFATINNAVTILKKFKVCNCPDIISQVYKSLKKSSRIIVTTKYGWFLIVFKLGIAEFFFQKYLIHIPNLWSFKNPIILNFAFESRLNLQEYLKYMKSFVKSKQTHKLFFYFYLIKNFWASFFF